MVWSYLERRWKKQLICQFGYNENFLFKKILGDFAKIKKSLQDKNSSLLNEVFSINKMYLKQKRRKYCKNCLKPIKKISFVSFGVSYSSVKFAITLMV